MDLEDPDAPSVRSALLTRRQAWLALRACGTLLLGLGMTIYSFTHHNGLGACLDAFLFSVCYF